jgi:hypothetical protein
VRAVQRWRRAAARDADERNAAVKGIIVSAVMALVCFCALTIGFRTLRVRRRAAFMVGLWFLTVPAFVIVHRLTPANLGLLPASLTEPWPLADLLLGLFAYAAVFFGGILQLYNLADRGLSLRVLIDLAAAGPMTVDQLVKAYSAGQGLRWMYAKRLEGLIDHDLVRCDGGCVTLTASGRRTAIVFAWLQRALRIE